MCQIGHYHMWVTLLKKSLLFFGWEQSVFECFKSFIHAYYYTLKEGDC